MMTGIFSDTGLDTSCPSGTTQFTTGFEGDWSGHVACATTAPQVCPLGEYLPPAHNSCTACPENSYCLGGTFSFNGTTPQGATACATGLYSPVGSTESAQCGHILHIGDEVLYLRSTKITPHALHVDVDHDGVADFFGNMTTADVVMHAGSEHKLKVKLDGVIYSIYDDTVTIP